MTIRNQITTWIRDYATTNSINSLVIGVSGGIDSAVVSTLCAETQLPTVVVSMPIRQNTDELLRAEQHMNWLTNYYSNVTAFTFDLTRTFEQFEQDIEHNLSSKFANPLAFANSRSRLRMITLYQIAQSLGGLVVGTGNKVEDFGVGFFTKWGDGGVDISPIGDLYKSQVYALAQELDIIPEIINAAPTDGLWGDSRTDEDQLGTSYDELEWAMQRQNTPNITERQEQVLKIYQKFHNRNQHKMQPIPICKISQ
jgi:NAD+ synthase